MFIKEHKYDVSKGVIGPWNPMKSASEKSLSSDVISFLDFDPAVIKASYGALEADPSHAKERKTRVDEYNKSESGKSRTTGRSWNGFILHHPGGFGNDDLAKLTVSALIEIYKSKGQDPDKLTDFDVVKAIKIGEAKQWYRQFSMNYAHIMIGAYGDIYVWSDPFTGSTTGHAGSPNSRRTTASIRALQKKVDAFIKKDKNFSTLKLSNVQKLSLYFANAKDGEVLREIVKAWEDVFKNLNPLYRSIATTPGSIPISEVGDIFSAGLLTNAFVYENFTEAIDMFPEVLGGEYKQWQARWSSASGTAFKRYFSKIPKSKTATMSPIFVADKILGGRSSSSINRSTIGIDFILARDKFKTLIAQINNSQRRFGGSVNAQKIAQKVQSVFPESCGGKSSEYTTRQMESFLAMAATLKRIGSLQKKYNGTQVLGHEDVTPVDRPGGDPGPTFCWDKIGLPERMTGAGRGSSLSRIAPGKLGQVNPDFIGGFTPESFLDPADPGRTHVLNEGGLDGEYITPEEVRKGIIPAYFQIQDWHLVTLGEAQGDNVGINNADTRLSVQSTSRGSSGPNLNKSGSVSTNRRLSQAAAQNSSTVFAVLDDPDGESFTTGDWVVRDRLATTIVEAEFYRRRFAARSVPSCQGPFNPYVTAGFPGLILSPLRPVIGMVSSVNHNIDVASATASTIVSIKSPRYWDEGDPFYYIGGMSDESQGNSYPGVSIHSTVGVEDLSVLRNFPVNQNRYTVATNSAKGPTNLDRFYSYFLGCRSIEYLSNHSDFVASANQVIGFYEDKKLGTFDYNEETLDLRDYNVLIASIDKDGSFSKGTLAEKFWGRRKPSSTEIEMKGGSYSSYMNYVEREIVNEKELIHQFLGNTRHKIKSYKGTTQYVTVGPTFANSSKSAGEKITLNSIQKMMLDYNVEMSRRSTNTEGTE